MSYYEGKFDFDVHKDKIMCKKEKLKSRALLRFIV